MALGFGIVGCGMISEFHARAISDINGAKLVACHDRIPKSANRFATQHSINAYAELNDFFG